MNPWKSVVSIFLLAGLAVAADHSKDPVAMRLQIHWKGRSITVADKKTARTYYFEDDVEAYQIHTARLQSAREANGAIYLLFDVAGYSLGPEPSPRGTCGSGEEKNLIWLKVDSNWKPLDRQSVLYFSCTQNIELHNDQEPTWKGDDFTALIDDWGKKETRKIVYSLGAPDKGLQVSGEGALGDKTK